MGSAVLWPLGSIIPAVGPNPGLWVAWRGTVARLFAVGLAGVTCLGCSSDDDADADPLPVVEQIDDAIAAVEDRYDERPLLFEVSANLVDVRVIVAEGWSDQSAEAVSYAYRDGELSAPAELGVGEGNAFGADAIDIDHATLFDQLRNDLPESLVTDFAITAGPDDAVIYDATVRSPSGGQLRVRLSGDGTVLEVMAE